MEYVLLTTVLTLAAWAVLLPYVNRKISRAIHAPEVIERMRAEVQSIIVELNQTTERNVELIEDRIAQLNEVLSRADRRLGVLKRETEKRDTASQVYSQLVKARATQQTSGEDRRGNLREKVLDLHRKGISPPLIANRLGTTVGEVELIISLREGSVEPAE